METRRNSEGVPKNSDGDADPSGKDGYHTLSTDIMNIARTTDRYKWCQDVLTGGWTRHIVHFDPGDHAAPDDDAITIYLTVFYPSAAVNITEKTFETLLNDLSAVKLPSSPMK